MMAHRYFTASEVILRPPNLLVTYPYVLDEMLGPFEPIKSLDTSPQRHLKKLGFLWIYHYEQSLYSENHE